MTSFQPAPRRRTAAWLVLLVTVGVALTVGAWPPSGPATPRQQAAAIDAVIKCPTCQGLSVADSSSQLATTIRAQVLADVEAHQSAPSIEDHYVALYGPGVLLRPGTGGAEGLVWLLPVLAVTAAAAALATVFWRRRSTAALTVTVDLADRDAVRAAMAREGEAGT